MCFLFISNPIIILFLSYHSCASARRLAQLLPYNINAKISLYEIGRGPGGRASTRKTRDLPHIYINHGAPYADIRTTQGKSIINNLGSNCILQYKGIIGTLDSTSGTFSKDTKEDKVDYITGAYNKMSNIASSLLTQDIDSSIIDTKYKTMIRGLSYTVTADSDTKVWQLKDKANEVIDTADWLIVAGSGIAHPRWTAAFGGEPPLIAAEVESPDTKLRQALDAIGKQEVSPRMAVFFVCSGDDARKWRSLDFDVANINNEDSILSKIIIQDDTTDSGDDWCSVVLHSTEAFATENSSVYGRTSSAARVGGATDESLEDDLIDRMLTALKEIPGLPTPNVKTLSYGPLLHRWGNAFPKGLVLSHELGFVPSSCVTFCGDYVSSPEMARLGSLESALLSGTHAGEQVAKYILDDIK